MPMVPADAADSSGTITNHQSPWATVSTRRRCDLEQPPVVGRPAELLHHLGVELQRLGQGQVLVGVGEELHARS